MGFIRKNVKICFLLAVIVIIAGGFACRLKCCYWGLPLRLHVDERYILDPIFDMLERHSWEADTIYRPDQFEIKCDAVIFTIISWIKWRMPAAEAYKLHPSAFTFMGRFYTTVFGIALIVLTGVFVSRLFRDLEKKYRYIMVLTAVFLTAFYSTFIQHSAYITPDIVLAFVVILFAYGMMQYIENGSRKSYYLCVICIAISITIKYPGAILCIPFAGMVIYRALWVDHDWKDIFKKGVGSIALILFVIFVIAPNIFTNIQAVIVNFANQNGDHFGLANLGFAGNFKYYFTTFQAGIGVWLTVPLVLGFLFLFVCRTKRSIALLTGLVYWVCISVLTLHWERWGTPIYSFFIILIAVGVGGSFWFLDRLFSSAKIVRNIGYAGISVFLLLIFSNVLLTGLCETKEKTIKDSRQITKVYCEENGITPENTISEGYTAFSPDKGSPSIRNFHLTEDGVRPNLKIAAKKYFIRANTFKVNYAKEPEKYPEMNALYNNFEKTYRVIFTAVPDGNYTAKKDLFESLKYSVDYLKGHQTIAGDHQYIYDLAPVYLTLQTADGAYLQPAEEKHTGVMTLSKDTYQWIRYEDDNGNLILISDVSGFALAVSGGKFTNNTKLRIAKAKGNVNQQWNIIYDGDYGYLVCDDGKMALTYDGSKVFLTEFNKGENQRLLITYL